MTPRNPPPGRSSHETVGGAKLRRARAGFVVLEPGHLGVLSSATAAGPHRSFVLAFCSLRAQGRPGFAQPCRVDV